MTDEIKGIVIPFNDISVKTCKCYVDYWKSVRETKGPKTIYHDKSIEKVKTFRKFFPEEKLLLYYCVDCFQKVLVDIPYYDIISEMHFRLRGGCIGYFAINEKFCDEICDSCVMFVFEKFSSNFVTV